MKVIAELVDELNEELESAKIYAEKSVSYKVDGDSTWSNRFKEMANDEMKHAMNIHELIVSKIEKLRTVYTPPESMMEKWEKSHKEYIEKMAWIKMMLSL